MALRRQSIPAPSERGFTLFELVVVVILVGTLVAVASSRLIPYVAQAERVAVARIEGQLRGVLGLEAATLIARGESARLMDLDGVNPMSLVLEAPSTYLGELNAPTRQLLPPRSWHFDTQRRRLVYRAGRGFEGSRSQPVFHEYVVRVVYRDADRDGHFSAAADEFRGVRLTRVNGR